MPGRTPDTHATERLFGRIALFVAGLFIVVESANRLFDLYRVAPWVDVPSHFLSGVVVTAAALWIRGRGGSGLAVWEAVILNVGVALAWEGVELVDEAISPDPPYLDDYFLWDGFWDVVSAVAGAVVLILCLALRGRRRAGDR